MMTQLPRGTTLAASLATIALLATALAHVRAARAAEVARHTDTIANVAAAGKASLAAIEPAQVAMTDAMNVLSRMASDTTFQKRVLQYSNKQDAAGLTSYLQTFARGSTVSVQKVADFFFFANFTVRGHSVKVCVSSEQLCGSSSATVEVS